MFGKLNTPVAAGEAHYHLQGIDLVQLAKDYGTPCFVYDLDHVIAQYKSLFEAIKWPRLKIFYAMKANFNPDIMRALFEAGANVDTVSPAEVLWAKRVGFTNDRILYTANNLTEEEIRSVKEMGVLFNIDSLSCLERYGALCPNTDVSLRFNSDVVAGEHKIVQTGGDKTKFGIRLEHADRAVEIAKRHNLKIVGVHEHTGSGITDAALFCEGMTNLMAIVTPARFPDLRFVDFGGGFKVPYRPDEKKIDYIALGAEVTALFTSFCKAFGRELDLYFEPGKYLVAECAMLLVQVNTIKDNKSRLIAGTDSGFNHIIRPILYEAYHHILNASNMTGEAKTYDICGNICETGDLFASDRLMPEVREGDYLAILNAGAYCYSMGSLYNMRPMPAEVVVQGGKARISRPRVSPAELVEKMWA